MSKKINVSILRNASNNSIIFSNQFFRSVRPFEDIELFVEDNEVVLKKPLGYMPFDSYTTMMCDDGYERQVWIHATGYKRLNRYHGWEAEYQYPDGTIG